MKPVFIIGGGGHAIVCVDLLKRRGAEIVGYVALTPSEQMGRLGVPYYGKEIDPVIAPPDDIVVVNGIGLTVASERRQQIFREVKNSGYTFATLVHDTTILADSVILEEGAQIMAGAIIQAFSTIGANSIVNTKCSIDHECQIGPHSHLAPGTTLCGGVLVGSGVIIGAGATVIPQLRIGDHSVVGAGSVVIRNVNPNTTVIGVPARETRI